MAERRMFTQKIIDSDAFLDMPLSTQCLYFHLSMRADDDGFVNNPKKIQRVIGASDDDLKILLTKRFLLGFESGVVVIKHWRMHNILRKDRYNPTQYQEEYEQLTLKDNGSYTENNTLVTNWQPNGNQMATQDSIGKVSIDKNIYISSFSGDLTATNDEEMTKIDPQMTKLKTPLIEELFLKFWKAYPKKVGKQDALKSFKKIKPNQELVDKMISVINDAKDTEQWTKNGGQYIPNPSTWLNQGRWEDDISTYTRRTSAEGRTIESDRYADIPY